MKALRSSLLAIGMAMASNAVLSNPKDLEIILNQLLARGEKVAILLINYQHPTASDYDRLGSQGMREYWELVDNTMTFLNKYKNNDNVFFITTELHRGQTAQLIPNYASHEVEKFITIKRRNYYERMAEIEITPSLTFDDEEEYANILSYKEWLGRELTPFFTRQGIDNIVPIGNNVEQAVQVMAGSVVRNSTRRVLLDIDMIALYEPPAQIGERAFRYPSLENRVDRINTAFERLQRKFPQQVVITTTHAPACTE